MINQGNPLGDALLPEPFAPRKKSEALQEELLRMEAACHSGNQGACAKAAKLQDQLAAAYREESVPMSGMGSRSSGGAAYNPREPWRMRRPNAYDPRG